MSTLWEESSYSSMKFLSPKILFYILFTILLSTFLIGMYLVSYQISYTISELNTIELVKKFSSISQ